MGKEVAEGWEISVQVVVGRALLKQQAGSEGRRCGVDRPVLEGAVLPYGSVVHAPRKYFLDTSALAEL